MRYYLCGFTERGIYGSASEVVRAALRKFFHVSEEDDSISSEEIKYIREVVGPRLEALHNGTAVTHDFDEACNGINKKVFE